MVLLVVGSSAHSVNQVVLERDHASLVLKQPRMTRTGHRPYRCELIHSAAAWYQRSDTLIVLVRIRYSIIHQRCPRQLRCPHLLFSTYT